MDVKIDTFEWIFYSWSHFGQRLLLKKEFRISSTKQSLDVKIDTFEWTFYSWSHYGQRLSLKKEFRIFSTKQSLDVKIDTFEWTFYSWSHYGQRLSLKKEFRISSTKQSSDSNLFMKSLWSKTFVEKKVPFLLFLAAIKLRLESPLSMTISQIFLATVTFGVFLASFLLVTWNWTFRSILVIKKLCFVSPSTMTISQIFFSNSYIWRFSYFWHEIGSLGAF